MVVKNQMQHRFYPEALFGGFTGSDGTIAFYSRVQALASGRSAIDFGCGRGHGFQDPVPFRRDLRSLRGKAARVLGLDVDVASGRLNPLVDEFRALDPKSPWPVENESCGLVLADCVIEHLPSPASFFSESYRSLEKDGYLAIRTTNVLSYIGLAARFVPTSMHTGVLSRVQIGREEQDVFPTLYRCNSIRALRRQIRIAGFRQQSVYGYESEPQYLAFSGIAYRLGVWHQKLAPHWIKPVIFAFARK